MLGGRSGRTPKRGESRKDVRSKETEWHGGGKFKRRPDQKRHFAEEDVNTALGKNVGEVSLSNGNNTWCVHRGRTDGVAAFIIPWSLLVAQRPKENGVKILLGGFLFL